MSNDLLMPPELRAKIEALSADLGAEAERLLDIARAHQGAPREIQAKILAATMMVALTTLDTLSASRPVPAETIALALVPSPSRRMN